MKIKKLFTFALVAMAAYSFSSCTCDCEKNNATSLVDTNKEVSSSSTRGMKTVKDAFTSVESFKYEGSLDKIEVIGKIKVDGNINSEDDAEAIKSIMRILMGAENPNQLLDIQISMSDEPVEDGMFVFSIKSPDEKNLTLQMYDEEGFDMVAYNKLQLNSGNNYKALNVNEFENGTYLFKLTDESGKEIIRRVAVDKK
jgi:hypothetical protein